MSDNEFSRDGDSPDALSRVPPSDVDSETLQKLREQVSFMKMIQNSDRLRINEYLIVIKILIAYLISKFHF